MRIARTSAGMSLDGEPLIPMRSPFGLREGGDPDLSFNGSKESDPLRDYEDHVGSSPLTRPRDQELVDANPGPLESGRFTHRPYHPAFGEKSVVVVKQLPSVGVAYPSRGDKTCGIINDGIRKWSECTSYSGRTGTAADIVFFRGLSY